MKVLTYLITKLQELQGQQGGSVGSVGAIPALTYQFTTRSVQHQFSKTAWLKLSDQPAMTVRGILQGLASDNWVRVVKTESTDKGGRPAELWELHPQAHEYQVSLNG